MSLLAPIVRTNYPDGIYFNPVEGIAGVDWPVGTPEHPVNNLEDAITIMTARAVRKLYLAGSRTFTGTHTAANNATIMTDANNLFKPGTLIGWTIYNDTDGSSGVITANDEHTITVAALAGGGANIWTTDDVYHVADALGNRPYIIIFDRNVELDLVGNGLYEVIMDGVVVVTFTNGLNCLNLINTIGEVNILGNCQLGGLLTNSGNTHITGDLKVAGGIANDGGQILIGGNCWSGLIEQFAGDEMIISGNCQIAAYLNNSGGSSIRILGNLDINGPSCDEGGDLDNSDGLLVMVGGNCHVARTIYNDTGDIRICGDCQVGADIDQGEDGSIVVYGTCKIGGTLWNESGVEGCTIEFKDPDAWIDLNGSADSLIERIVSRGSLHITTMVAGATAIIDLCGGALEIAADCTGGTINLYGDCALNDLSGGAVTVNDYRVPGHS